MWSRKNNIKNKLLQKFLFFFKISYPKFWNKKNNFFDKIIILILLPFSFLFFLISRIGNFLRKKDSVGVPIICVGNLVTGGSGKTPIVLFLSNLFKKKNVHIITRGYGGNLKGPIKVDKKLHNLSEVGDEALLLAKENIVWVSKNKYEGVFAATLNGAELIILDDGLQNNSIKKDFNIIVVDGDFGFGNGLMLPAGPLRENVNSGIKKADLLILLDNDTHDIKTKLKGKINIIEGKSIIKDYEKLKNKKLIAFTGIGRPEKFLNSLKKRNLNIIRFYPFPDHYLYREKDLKKLIKHAKEKGAVLVTTLKDKERIKKSLKKNFYFVDLQIKIKQLSGLKTKLKLKKIA